MWGCAAGTHLAPATAPRRLAASMFAAWLALNQFSLVRFSRLELNLAGFTPPSAPSRSSSAPRILETTDTPSPPDASTTAQSLPASSSDIPEVSPRRHARH